MPPCPLRVWKGGIADNNGDKYKKNIYQNMTNII